MISPHRILCQGSTQESQSFSEPITLQIEHSQAPIARTLTVGPVYGPSAFDSSSRKLRKGLLYRQPRGLKQGKYRQLVKGKMYPVHTSALPFKDKRLRNQVPTCTSTFACIFNQFRSSWRPGSNHTPRMRMGPSLHRKGPGRRAPFLQAPNCRSLLFSKLILAPAICSYQRNHLLHRLFVCLDTKTVISSAYEDTLAPRQPVKRIPSRSGFASSSLSLWSRGSKAWT